GLAKAALAAKIDGEVRDIMRPFERDASLALITSRDEKEALELARRDIRPPFEGDAVRALITSRDEKDALDLVRHDFAHILAEAVQNLFPGTQITFGPATDDVFYSDSAPTAERGAFTEEDLPAIEEEMRRVIAADKPLVREVWPRQKLIDRWREQGESFKAEWAAELPENEELTVYWSGKDWLDMCRG